MLKKVTVVIAVTLFLAAPALAGNRPEFDAVGDDSANFFNDFIKEMVVENALDRAGNQINKYSDFTKKGYEFFKNTAGLPYPDPCFPGYYSSLVDQYNSAEFEWQIVLQMKPESDIDLNIRDCVLKHNTFDPWFYADQTGRYRQPWGAFIFVPEANPRVTVKALPGPFATTGFKYPFFMDARTLPGLKKVILEDALYTSKGIWEEGIVMVMPLTGEKNCKGEAMYNLKQGDKINVFVEVPGTNTVDIFYGQDNVVLKYVGIVGTEYTTLN